LVHRHHRSARCCNETCGCGCFGDVQAFDLLGEEKILPFAIGESTPEMCQIMYEYFIDISSDIPHTLFPLYLEELVKT